MRADLPRRAVLAGLAAFASSAWADGAPRRAPDFDRLARDPFVVGVRPHRVGGVALGLTEVSAARKFLITNHGHGGAGVTLAWGCAAEVTDLVARVADQLGRTPSVAVIGVGVVGLASATALLRRFPGVELRMFAKDTRIEATTSWVAAGHFEVSGWAREPLSDEARARLDGWAERSRIHLHALRRDGLAAAYGVVEREHYAVDHPPGARTAALPFPGLDATQAQASRSFVVNPTLLLPRLLAQVRAHGVPIEARTFADRAAALALPEDVVVTCVGLGARGMGDQAVEPRRGHLVHLDDAGRGLDWVLTGGCGGLASPYVICRQTDVVVGGTWVAGDDRAAVEADDRPRFADVLRDARAVFAGSCRLGHAVELRPRTGP